MNLSSFKDLPLLSTTYVTSSLIPLQMAKDISTPLITFSTTNTQVRRILSYKMAAEEVFFFLVRVAVEEVIIVVKENFLVVRLWKILLL